MAYYLVGHGWNGVKYWNINKAGPIPSIFFIFYLHPFLLRMRQYLLFSGMCSQTSLPYFVPILQLCVFALLFRIGAFETGYKASIVHVCLFWIYSLISRSQLQALLDINNQGYKTNTYLTI